MGWKHLQLVGCGIVLKLIAGCGIKTASDLSFDLTRRGIGIKILKVAGWRDEAKLVVGWGI